MRVIAGRFRGRTLRAPRGVETRPTTDRVREALFAVLGSAIEDRRVLDLYAGSGALGIEALSRGAASVTFVESSRNALAALRNNVSTLQIDAEVTVISVAVERAAGRLQPYAPFELVLCDPPWDELDAAVQALSVLLGPSLLSEDAIVTLEHPASRGIELPASMPLEPWSVRTWGDTAVSIFRRAGS